MKRSLIIFCAVLFVVGTLMSPAFAKKADKVALCHVTDSVVVNDAGAILYVGHVIEVSANAVDAHLAHGDSLAIDDINDGPGGWFGSMTWADIATVWNLNLSGATCGGFMVP